MSSFNYGRVADRLAARVPQVAASIVDYRMVTPQLAQVIATFSTDKANRGDLTAAVGRALKNEASAIESSWRSLSSYGSPAMIGFVQVNAETRPYEEASASKMVALASNMLMDATDETLWQVQADGSGGKMLCRKGDDNLQALMETARVRAPRAPKLAGVLSSVNKGDFVAYIDQETASIRHGYVLATDMSIESVPVGGLDVDPMDTMDAIEIMPLPQEPDNTSDEAVGEGNRIAERMVEEDAPVLVPATLVVEAAALNGDDVNTEVAAPSNLSNKQAMKDYYKRMYANTPGYYAMLVKTIDSHAGI